MLTHRLLPLLSVLSLTSLSAPAMALPFDSTAVEIVEFTDYQCPFCARAEGVIAQLEREYGSALRVTVRHNPLPFHKLAKGAALAAEAAREQGQFMAMHERMFLHQELLAPSDLVAHATIVGMDRERFERDVASPAVLERVERDVAIASAVGATGTPTFFINGRELRGAQPVEEFKKLIELEVGEAARTNRRGDAWLSDRLNANNPALWGYLRGGQVPAPKPAVVIDETIYKVAVNPKVDAIDGPDDALITLVVFSDFQCPFCKKLESTIDTLMQRYPGKIRRVMKHTPLSFHERAGPAAAAAICAQAQGKYWEMHRSLFDDQQKLDDVQLKDRAATLGLKLAAFNKCLSAPATAKRIADDVALSALVTAKGTPNTYINGRKVLGAKPIEDFIPVIDAELKRAQGRLAEGVKPRDLYADLIKDGETFSPLEREAFQFVETKDTPILGNPKAKIRLTVFSDLQCPFCSRVHPVLKDVVEKYKGKVGVAWKHFPLSMHKDAMPAARAAACAQEQKKFWETVDYMFDHQRELAEVIPVLADKVPGLALIGYASCMNRNDKQASIDADMAEATAAAVRGTPTIYVQGRKFNSPNGYSIEALSAVIDALLAGKEP